MTTSYSACCMEGMILLGQDDGIVTTPVALANLEGHTSGVCDVKASAAGSMVLTGSLDLTVRLWDLRTGSICVRTMEGHTETVCSVDMDGHCRTAVSGSRDQQAMKLWDLGSGRCMETYEVHDDQVPYVVMHESREQLP